MSQMDIGIEDLENKKAEKIVFWIKEGWIFEHKVGLA